MTRHSANLHREVDRRAASRPGDERTPRGERAEPHALANELTDEPAVKARQGDVDVSDAALESPATAFATRQAALQRQRGSERAEKRVGRQMAMLVGAIIGVALLVAAILTRQWMLLGLALLMFIPFMILVSAPFWLAATTKTAQDEAVRAQRDERSQRADQPPR